MLHNNSSHDAIEVRQHRRGSCVTDSSPRPSSRSPLHLHPAASLDLQARLLGQTAAAPPVANALEEARSTYGRLMDLDPQRRGYYQDALEGRAFVVVKALGTT
jgi:geranylgeranyl transferase type-2 subunit alpha